MHPRTEILRICWLAGLSANETVEVLKTVKLPTGFPSAMPALFKSWDEEANLIKLAGREP